MTCGDLEFRDDRRGASSSTCVFERREAVVRTSRCDFVFEELFFELSTSGALCTSASTSTSSDFIVKVEDCVVCAVAALAWDGVRVDDLEPESERYQSAEQLKRCQTYSAVSSSTSSSCSVSKGMIQNNKMLHCNNKRHVQRFTNHMNC